MAGICSYPISRGLIVAQLEKFRASELPEPPKFMGYNEDNPGLKLDLPGPWKSRHLAEFPFGAEIKIKKDPDFAGPWKTKVI